MSGQRPVSSVITGMKYNWIMKTATDPADVLEGWSQHLARNTHIHTKYSNGIKGNYMNIG
jgi:hypothetical protein